MSETAMPIDCSSTICCCDSDAVMPLCPEHAVDTACISTCSARLSFLLAANCLAWVDWPSQALAKEVFCCWLLWTTLDDSMSMLRGVVSGWSRWGKGRKGVTYYMIMGKRHSMV